MPKAETKSTTFTLRKVLPKKNSVRFDAADGDPEPLINGAYASRLVAMKELGITDLEKVNGLKITVEVL